MSWLAVEKQSNTESQVKKRKIDTATTDFVQLSTADVQLVRSGRHMRDQASLVQPTDWTTKVCLSDQIELSPNHVGDSSLETALQLINDNFTIRKQGVNLMTRNEATCALDYTPENKTEESVNILFLVSNFIYSPDCKDDPRRNYTIDFKFDEINRFSTRHNFMSKSGAVSKGM
ncbi:hypothetical protein FBUS_08249 [Fasciolopsis buskii]|uniref:Uncharacterized protein n=1 Tax=Fasciolopsis buskii TaxID=27845 RepID=A0A8E0RX02_9TREM|nr:hypothetical protein FBUS_08249 [Fasciolopsis buski]